MGCATVTIHCGWGHWLLAIVWLLVNPVWPRPGRSQHAGWHWMPARACRELGPFYRGTRKQNPSLRLDRWFLFSWPWPNPVTCHLMTGIRSEKQVTRQCPYCVNISVCTCTNLDATACCTPRPRGTAYCSRLHARTACQCTECCRRHSPMVSTHSYTHGKGAVRMQYQRLNTVHQHRALTVNRARRAGRCSGWGRQWGGVMWRPGDQRAPHNPSPTASRHGRKQNTEAINAAPWTGMWAGLIGNIEKKLAG